MERIDLHTHTLASDGSDTPAAVGQQAAALGLRAVAVTDHDTFAGLPEALAAGQRCGIEVVTGVALSTVWGGEEVHLLGYFMDTGDAALRALMTRATDERNARYETFVQRLHDAGYPITMDDLHAAFPGQTVLGRPHIAARLLQRGCIASVPDGMRGLLGRGKAFYVPRYNIPLADSIRALRAAGGVPVVAHIFKYRFDDAQRAAMLAAAADAGAGSLYPINNVSRPISSLGQPFPQINLKKAQKQAHQSQSSFQSVLGFDEPLFKATPHNSRLAA